MESGPEDPLFEKMVTHQRPFQESKVLSKLTRFMHTHDDPSYGFGLGYLAWAMRLPNMRAVFAGRLGSGGGDPDEQLALLNPRSSPLEHLELRDCMLDTVDLEPVLSAPASLTTFIYIIGTGHTSYCDINFGEIRKALDLQHASLEQLYLDYTYALYGRDSEDNKFDIAPFTSLAKLKRFKVAVAYLFGYPEGRKMTPYTDREDRVDKTLLQLQERINKGEKVEWKQIPPEKEGPLPKWDEAENRRLLDVFPESLEYLELLHLEYSFKHSLRAIADLLEQRQASLSTTEPILPRLRELVLSGPMISTYAYWSVISELYGKADAQSIKLRTVDPGHPLQIQRSLRHPKEISIERGWGFDGEVEWAEGPNGDEPLPSMEVRVPLSQEEVERVMAKVEEIRVLKEEDEKLHRIKFGLSP